MEKLNINLTEYRKLGKFIGKGCEVGDYVYKLNADNKTLCVEVKENAKNKTSFDPFLSEVDGLKVTRADWCYANCTNMKHAPNIPDGIISMRAGYLNCFRLKETPVLPNSIEDISSICQNCHSLKKIYNFPESSKNMDYSFNGCCDLYDIPKKIPNSVSEMYATFSWCISMSVAPELPFAIEHLPATFSHTNIKARPLIPITVKDSKEDIEHTFCKCNEEDRKTFKNKKEMLGIFDDNIEKSIADEVLEKNTINIQEEDTNTKKYQKENKKEIFDEER